jgi:gas vesicle protein
MISVIAILTYSYTGVVLADDINVETRPICKTIMSKIDDKVPYEDWNQEEQKECWSCLEEKLKKAILAKGPDSSSKTRYGETLYQDKKKKKEKDRKQNIRNKIRTFTKVIKKIDENLPFEVWNPEEQGIYLKTKLTTDLEDTVKNFKEQLASSKEELSNRIEGLADETRKNKSRTSYKNSN